MTERPANETFSDLPLRERLWRTVNDLSRRRDALMNDVRLLERHIAVIEDVIKTTLTSPAASTHTDAPTSSRP
jgi:hypothetical protein